MPVTFVIAKELDINPIPFLITEILASNIGGTATLIGDPPNIIIGSAAGLSFMDFIKELTGIVAAILIVNVGILTFISENSLWLLKKKWKKLHSLIIHIQLQIKP